MHLTIDTNKTLCVYKRLDYVVKICEQLLMGTYMMHSIRKIMFTFESEYVNERIFSEENSSELRIYLLVISRSRVFIILVEVG